MINKPVIISKKVVAGENCHMEIAIDPATAYGYCQLYVGGKPVSKVLSGLTMIPGFFNTPTATAMLPGTVIDPSPAGKSFPNTFWRNWKPEANHDTPVQGVDYVDSDPVTVDVPADFVCTAPEPVKGHKGH